MIFLDLIVEEGIRLNEVRTSTVEDVHAHQCGSAVRVDVIGNSVEFSTRPNDYFACRVTGRDGEVFECEFKLDANWQACCFAYAFVVDWETGDLEYAWLVDVRMDVYQPIADGDPVVLVEINFAG